MKIVSGSDKLALEPGLHVLSGYPRPSLLRLEQPHRTTRGHHVNPDAKMGASVIIGTGWHNTNERLS